MKTMGFLLSLTVLLGSLDAIYGSTVGQTKYGCEGQVLEISCEASSVIQLVRANYGRFSISICNDKGETDWSVDCMQPRTLRILKSICDNKQSCSFPVNSTQFQDPCPGTSKYVEVHYSCKPLQSLEPLFSSTTNSIPPWLLALTATSARTTTTTTTTTTSTTEASTSTTSMSSVTAPPQTTTTTTTAFSTTSSSTPTYSDHSDQRDYFLHPDEFPPGHCAPLTSRNLFWNWTASGGEAIQVCPLNSRGFARWKCLDNGEWSSPYPDLSECQSLRISRLQSRLSEEPSSPLEISSTLASTIDSHSLYGGDLPLVAQMIRTLSVKLRQDLWTLNNQQQRENRVSSLLQNVLSIASNLLRDFQELAWKDLRSSERRAELATSLILGVEETSFLLAETLDTEKNLVESTPHILSSLRIMKSRYVTDQEFPGPINSHHFPPEELRILIPASVLADSADNGAVRLSFFLYDRLDEILAPTQGEPQFINSKVAGVVSEGGGGRSTKSLRQPISVSLRHLMSEGVSHTTCVTWDYVLKAWSSQYCSLSESNRTHTTCHCSRMGLYALLAEDVPSFLLDGGEEREIIQEEHMGEEESNRSGEYLAALIASLIGLLLIILVLSLLLIAFFRKKMMTDGGGLKTGELLRSCCCGFHCREKRDGGSSGDGFYPSQHNNSTMLSSSPTSTTTGSYMEHHPNHPPQYKSSLLLLKTHNLSHQQQQQQQQQLFHQQQIPHLNTGVRPPMDPFGHIYMEIDPVYSHSESSSDFLQESSDDDVLRRVYASSSSSSGGGVNTSSIPPPHYAEERPLISGTPRAAHHHHQSLGNKQQQPFFTAPIPQRMMSSRGNGSNSLRPQQVYPAPLAIATTQSGDQFVSLQIDKHNTGLVFSDI